MKMLKIYQKFVSLALVLYVSLICAVPAFATPTVDDLWTAMDITGINAKAIPILVLCVTLTVIGVVYAIVTKVGKKAKSAL